MRRSLFTLVFLLTPLFAFSQTDDLRAQIRADLMQDPRTAELSEAELDALVSALAQEAEASGEATVYLDAQTAPTFTYDPPFVSEENPIALILTAPIVIAIGAFLVALLGIVVYLLRVRRGRITPSPTEA